MTINDRITAACRRYGEKVTSDAAYAAMSGRPAALAAQGLGDLAGNLPALHRVTVLAYELMGDEDRAADLAEASISLAKLPTGQGPAA